MCPHCDNKGKDQKIGKLEFYCCDDVTCMDKSLQEELKKLENS
jgi:hypothetical protein